MMHILSFRGVGFSTSVCNASRSGILGAFPLISANAFDFTLQRGYSNRAFSSLGKGQDIFANVAKTEEQSPRLSVRGFGPHTFQVNESEVHGSVILLPKTYFMWNARKFEDITLESLAIFPLIHPRLEILFVGCGERMPGLLPKEITQYFKKKGIIVEASDSANAAATYNVLNGEGRNVAAALLSFDDFTDEERARDEI